jgi:hypothetical protein
MHQHEEARYSPDDAAAARMSRAGFTAGRVACLELNLGYGRRRCVVTGARAAPAVSGCGSMGVTGLVTWGRLRRLGPISVVLGGSVGFVVSGDDEFVVMGIERDRRAFGDVAG